MTKYGRLTKFSSFISRVISKTDDNTSFVVCVLKLFNTLDAVQISNPLVTTSIHVGGGMSVYWKGEITLNVWPAQKYLRVFWHNANSQNAKLERSLDAAQQRGDVQHYIGKSTHYSRRGWMVPESAFPILERFVTKLPRPTNKELKRKSASHPRYFSGEVRQIALDRFVDAGRHCPGIGSTKRHKLADGARIEFDHILPHALGGSNSEINVQVLCQACNNKKRATALGNAAS